MPDDQLVRIVFPLDAEQSGGILTERLWAKPVSRDTYVLDNSPFYVYGISYKDIVRAECKRGEILFREVASRGGHSTYRLKLPPGKLHSYFLDLWSPLKQFGCTYEGASGDSRRYSVDIPPLVAVRRVYEILNDLEQSGICEFEEGYYFPAAATSQ
jgi:hypothetical protein